MSKFASSFCLSLMVKLRTPAEDEDCIVFGLRKKRKRIQTEIGIEWPMHVTRVPRLPTVTQSKLKCPFNVQRSTPGRYLHIKKSLIFQRKVLSRAYNPVPDFC